MADQKITQLTEDTDPAVENIVPVCDDPSGTPVTKKATISNIIKSVNLLAAESSPATSDIMLLIDDPSGTPTPKKVTVANILGLIPPTYLPAYVRCSLVSGDPNPIADQSAKTDVYVMPYGGNAIPLWNGSKFAATEFAELTAALNATYQTAGNVYDIYVFDDSGTIRAGFGVAWTSAASRGTGAGTAETETVNGVDVNKNQMTVRNGASSYTVTARYGTLVGTVAISTSGQVNRTSSLCEISNQYNPLPFSMFAVDTTNSWTYTTATWRAANGSTVNGVMRVTFVAGRPTKVYATHNRYAYHSAGTWGATGIGINATNTNSAQRFGTWVITAGVDVPSIYSGTVAEGLNYIQALEISNATGTMHWYGNGNAPTFLASALIVDIEV